MKTVMSSSHVLITDITPYQKIHLFNVIIFCFFTHVEMVINKQIDSNYYISQNTHVKLSVHTCQIISLTS